MADIALLACACKLWNEDDELVYEKAAGDDVYILAGAASNRTEFAAAFGTTNIYGDPKFAVRGRDFRLQPTSPCANPGSRDRVYMGGSVLYLPQWAYGALPPVFEPIKPVE